MKSIIIYFSRADENYNVGYIEKGNTEIIAEYIQEATGSDIFKIEPKEKYPADYYECIDLAKKELQSKARPELVEYLDNVEEYDLIYLGFPNWWGDVPMCVYTFLDDCDLSGKTIKPFCTHEGSGFGGILHKLESKYGLEFEDGLSIQGSSVSGAKSKVENWL